MRSLCLALLVFFFSQAYGQFPYVKKLNYPDQLPTQVVYDMLTDSRGYIWIGTDKGLFRFNGRGFVAIPFQNSSSKSVSYLQEDNEGTLWCMNFYNQVFSVQKDTLRRFEIDPGTIREVPSFKNVLVGSKEVWLHSFKTIYVFDKKSGRFLHTIASPTPLTVPGSFSPYDAIMGSVYSQSDFYVFSYGGFLYTTSGPKSRKWLQSGHAYSDFRFIKGKGTQTGIGIGFERRPPFEISAGVIKPLPPINLPPDIYIFQGARTDNNELWLCTQNGAFRWNKTTGETHCYLPNERVTDVVKDYQGNYWFSTLDNGVFFCASLYNTLLKVYKDPLMDNFTKLTALPSGELVAGNSHGLMARINLVTGDKMLYQLDQSVETEFIQYDTLSGYIISNRGVFRPNSSKPVEKLDYNKGITRDAFGNLVFAVHNGAYIINDHFGSYYRLPAADCPLYAKYINSKKDTGLFDGRHISLVLRQKRALSVLASGAGNCFWVGYEDGLYEYHYDGTILELKDENGMPVIARRLIQQADGKLVVGTSNRGVIVFEKNKPVSIIGISQGLSSLNVRKLVPEGNDIWVLTDEGLDRINGTNKHATNYLEEYGLNSIVINDFLIAGGKIIFATAGGILLRYNLPRFYNSEIRFPYCKAISNGVELKDGQNLPGNGTDISFYFEAIHYLSPATLSYQYRLKGIDTLWHPVGSFANQLSFNRLSPGKYVFEIRAKAGVAYQSVIRSFTFQVPRPFWKKVSFFLLLVLAGILLLWVFMWQWKKNLLQKQEIKEALLKSQLVALRAQMNPHFLYNVLNTVQGLVYGNRKTEAGELLGNFSDLMRKTLQASDKQLLPLKDEIENIRLYLELEKARYEEGFSYELVTEGIDDIALVNVPSLMLQPFVENAVKHGLMHKQGDKNISIRFAKEAEGFRVTIDDNGIGRAQSMEINQRSKNKPFSFATVALNERMDLFNRLYSRKITCRIIDKFGSNQLPSGTRVELFIPDYSNDPRAL